MLYKLLTRLWAGYDWPCLSVFTTPHVKSIKNVKANEANLYLVNTLPVCIICSLCHHGITASPWHHCVTSSVW